MEFKITALNLEYKVPTQESIDEIEKQITELCYERIRDIYIDSPAAVFRLELELAVIKQRRIAFNFILLKEIADFSHEEGYPIMASGDLSSSLIAFLLGIISFNPLTVLGEKKAKKDESFVYTDIVWTSLPYCRRPNLTISIAQSVRPLLIQRLNEKFQLIEESEKLSFGIYLETDKACDNIGKLAKLTGELPEINQFNNEVYLPIIKDLAECYQERLGKSFVKELNSITSYDFYTLVRIYGYIHASFFRERKIEDLYNPNFYTLRDEFYEALLSYGMPNDIAYYIVKDGIWSRKENREEYFCILDKYRASQELKDYFNVVANLQSTSDCISHMEVMCTVMWYKINYPKEFASVYQNELEKE